MKTKLTRCAVLLAIFLGSAAKAETFWTGLYKGVDIAKQQLFISSEGEELSWSGIRIRTGHAQLQLIDTKSFLERLNLSKAGGKSVSGVSSGLISTFGYSLDEVWFEVESDRDVKAVVPIGYVEESGSPQIAGFFKKADSVRNPLMNAPNLTSVFCLNAETFRASNKPDETVFQTGVAPYLFDVETRQSGLYQYLDGQESLDLLEDLSPGRLQGYFDSCQDAVQVGPKVAFPRRQEVTRGREPSLAGTRRSADTDVFRGGRKAYRTYFSWDLRGDITIFTTLSRASLDTVWELISDRDFYRDNADCSSSGITLSKACEYWVVALTSFEHSGLIYRDKDGQGQPVRRTDSVVPAALVVRVMDSPE
ncbi:hypothetical protein shim_05670 [Shimia sp. SK013]|uniref:hypothetical protein n=1 Tax=Shimia sp. SK013 TaxID=1389006 RepID=UPI0006B5DB4F|nr:hypothetical protein [Shimia sp. SK013]KPA22289.1 hypothetical protein shim_05670 [Shimia sp. SK013]